MYIVLEQFSTKQIVKTIFHQTAKYLASGLALGNAPDARILHYPTQNIPTCWYILHWVTHIFCVLPDEFYPTRFIRRVLPDASQWNIGGVGPSGVGAGVGHVHFIFFV